MTRGRGVWLGWMLGYLLVVTSSSAWAQTDQLIYADSLVNGWSDRSWAIPLASFSMANQPNMDGFWIQNDTETTQPPFYVDDIRLTAAPVPAVVNVTVDASQVLRTIDARHFGVNTATWDSRFKDPTTPTTKDLLIEMGSQTLRFPGGSTSDNYHWESQPTPERPVSFDDFANVAKAIGAKVFITVNYGSGTPAEAARWVSASVAKGYGVTYWEIGNEVYLNDSDHIDTNDRPHDPYTYAHRFKDYYDRMKAADPTMTIKIGAVAAPGEDLYQTYFDHPATNPRTGQKHNGWTPVMLATLKSLGVTPDFLIHHRYPQAPGTENDAALLQSSSTWAVEAANLRQQLTDYLGAAGAGVELVCTETNSVYANPGKQTTSLVNGLFFADNLGAAMKTEFNGVVWWDLREGKNSTGNSSPYGWRNFGTFGVLNGPDNGLVDRYPTFYVAKLLKHFARGGDRLVEASSDSPLLSVYAARRADGSLTLLAVNKDPMRTLNANIALHGYSPNRRVQVYSYGIPQDEAAHTGVGSDIAPTCAASMGPTFPFMFPPYSVTMLSLNGAQSDICYRDFDGDGKADLAIYRQATGEWFIFGSATGFQTRVFGAPATSGLGDTPVPGDFDGDGKTDLAIYRKATGEWFIFGSATGFQTRVFGAAVAFGLDDLPIPADFDGDGKTDLAIYRQATGEWFIFGSATGLQTRVFGAPASSGLGDTPVPRDFDGDGKRDFAVYRAATGEWFIFGSAMGFQTHVFGGLGDTPVPEDFDGDGKTDLAIYRKATGEWFIFGSATGFQARVFGAPASSGLGDIPLP